MKAMGVRLNGQTIGVIQVPDKATPREVMRAVWSDSAVACRASPTMTMHATVGVFVVRLTMAVC